jgi:hypothetical protein
VVERHAGGALRWTRAVLLTAVALGSGVVAHLSAQGLMPGFPAIVVLFCLGTAISASLLGRPASTRRVVLMLIGGQTFVHATLTALSGHRGDPPLRRVTAAPLPVATAPSPVPGGRHGSYFDVAYAQAHPAAANAQLTLPAPVQHLIADFTGPHAAMAVAHLVAAALVGLWLAAGERALWALLGLAVDRARSVLSSRADALGVLARLAAGLTRLGSAQRYVDPPDLPRPGRALARCVVRRGPPPVLAG